MDQAINGVNLEISVSDKTNVSGLANGTHTNGFHEPSPEELERELPMVYDGQVPLGDVLSRVVQSIYAELSELAETYVPFPNIRCIPHYHDRTACPTCLTVLENGL
jgi:mediator of RNA polymerase II transcription subunit 14